MKYIAYHKKLNKKQTALVVVTILFVFTMFSFSLLPSNESSSQSDFFLDLINSLLKALRIYITVTAHIVRKTAHFTEYFIYGNLLTLTVGKITNNLKNNRFMILFFALLVPVIDETLQCFSFGRSAEVKDVLLDFTGCIAGILLMHVILKKKAI